MDECVTVLNANFRSVFLHEEVLKAILGGLNSLGGDRMNIENRSVRYVGYLICTWWVHNRLGRGVRKAIPSCAVWSIRNVYPEQNMSFVPFQEAKDETVASLQ